MVDYPLNNSVNPRNSLFSFVGFSLFAVLLRFTLLRLCAFAPLRLGVKKLCINNKQTQKGLAVYKLHHEMLRRLFIDQGSKRTEALLSMTHDRTHVTLRRGQHPLNTTMNRTATKSLA